MNNELQHYGILGMKWGVRRTPEQLGRNPRTGKYVSYNIKKGTKLYRVSAKPNDAKGIRYFSMLPPDRDRYRGSRLGMEEKYVTKYMPKDASKQKVDTGKAYETTYVTKKSLRIANVADISQQFLELRSDKKLMEDMAKHYAKTQIDAIVAREKERGNFYPEQEVESLGKYYSDRYLKNFGKVQAKEQNAVMAESFSFNAPGFRDKVVERLKQKGFDGLMDEDGAAGYFSPREGVSPLIVFDSEKVLDKKQVTPITEKIRKRAGKRYAKWYSQVNSRKSMLKNYNW